MQKKIGILYIATGRYTIFWDEFYESCQKYFLPNHEKHYFVFTDKIEEISTNRGGTIHKIYQEKLGWPYDTLMRFDIFLKAEEMLKEMDYIFFFNANMDIIDYINDEEIFVENKGLIGFKHPGFYNKTNDLFTYDRNPNSLAYIPMGEGEYYFMGSFNGGKSSDFLTLIHSLKRNVEIDLEKNIIALWHDESHLNHYFWQHQDNVLILSEKYGVAEWNTFNNFLKGYKKLKTEIKNKGGKIIIKNKSHYRYGGSLYLRGITNHKIGFLTFLKKHLWQFLRKYIS